MATLTASAVRPRQRARSLRFKLTAWYLLVFSTIQLALIAAVILFRGQEAIDLSIRDRIARSARAMVENILVAEPELEAGALVELMPADARFRLFAVREPTGNILVAWNVQEAAELPFGAREKVPAGPRGEVFGTIDGEAAERLIGAPSRLQVVTVPFRYREQDLFLQAAVPSSVFQGFIGPYQDLVFVALPIGTFAALLAAWFIAGRAVAPIRLLSHAAREVNPESLGQRIRIETADEEITVLQEELNDALERLERGFRAQERFVSNLSHELKTPIAVLLTEAQVVQRGTPSHERLLEWAQTIERQMRRIADLVETFLHLTRAEMSPELHFDERVALNDVVLDAVHHATPLAGGGRVKLLPHLADGGGEDAEIVADERLLRALFENLLRNAVLHSPPGGAVDVVAEIDGGHARVAVRDRGPGIPEPYLERVFDRFFRVPGSESKGGTGLGLSIARSIATLAGGDIRAENHPQGGCVFTVSLPLAEPVERPAPVEA